MVSAGACCIPHLGESFGIDREHEREMTFDQ
jgi:hypothetical protein